VVERVHPFSKLPTMTATFLTLCFFLGGEWNSGLRILQKQLLKKAVIENFNDKES
jgi:hypothetical protein